MTRRLDIATLAAFSDEVRASIPGILTALDAVERDGSDTAAVEEAFRLIHALKGAASMVGLAGLGYLLNHAEELVDTVMTAGDPFPAGLLATLRDTAPRFGEYLDAALGGRPIDTVAYDVLRAYRRLANQPEDVEDATLNELLDLEQKELALRPEPAPPAPADYDIEITPSEPIPTELAEVFAQEAQEHLQTIARLTVLLGASPADRESLLELRRAVHTIKGAAGVVGYKAASRLAHRMEDLLDTLAEGAAVLTPESTRLLTASSDALDDLISGGPDPADLRQVFARLLGEYDRLVAFEPQAEAIEAAYALPAEPVAVEPAFDAALAAVPAAVSVVSPVADRRRGARDRREAGDDRRGGSQVVRVPFQRLNELVRIVSELVLNRATFDQHYAELIDQVDELRLSTSRLRRVALKLETDYEVRALSGRFAAAAGPYVPSMGGRGFDALEFDRYTDFHLLTRELAETANDIGTVTTRLGETIGDFDGDLTRLGRLTREVQDKAMEFRMVPLVTLAARLERAVRVTAQECGKAIDLVLEGENVALDKTLLEEMADALAPAAQRGGTASSRRVQRVATGSPSAAASSSARITRAPTS
jgi:chemosensory pili system protein ChpA (sensor histidine kinase/response regulator)